MLEVLAICCAMFGTMFFAAGIKLAIMRKPGPAVTSMVLAAVWFGLTWLAG